MTDRDKTVKRWEALSASLLIGLRVKAVQYMTEENAKEALDWDQSPLMIILADDAGGNQVIIFPSRDDEGNGPGALFTDDAELPTIPVI